VALKINSSKKIKTYNEIKGGSDIGCMETFLNCEVYVA
jgi:hypothetical protein